MARKITPPDDPAACKTVAEQVGYSMRLKEIYDQEVCSWNSPPSALTDFQMRYPFNPAMPWTCPSFAGSYARSQEEKERALRAMAREEKRQLNRMLYRKA